MRTLTYCVLAVIAYECLMFLSFYGQESNPYNTVAMVTGIASVMCMGLYYLHNDMIDAQAASDAIEAGKREYLTSHGMVYDELDPDANNRLIAYLTKQEDDLYYDQLNSEGNEYADDYMDEATEAEFNATMTRAFAGLATNRYRSECDIVDNKPFSY